MAQFISAPHLKDAVQRLQNSRAVPAFANYLIVKRAIVLDPDDTITLSQNDPELKRAIREVMEWVTPEREGEVKLPLINVFGTARYQDRGYRGPRYYSNGTADAIDHTRWTNIVTVSRIGVREVKLGSPSADDIKKVCLKNGKERRPSLFDAALWYFRQQDVEELVGQAPSQADALQRLGDEFKQLLNLSAIDVETLFDSDLNDIDTGSQPDGWLTGEVATPEEYLPQGVPKNEILPFPEVVAEHLAPSAVVKAVQDFLRAQGLIFDDTFIEAFLLALKTKPLVILSGISGTGKSALPRALMKMVGNEVGIIAVAPDWTDNADMLGYFDVHGHFVPGAFTTVVQKASDNPDRPFFVVLDEMNLARVEYYFAATLSAIESRRFDSALGEVVYGDSLFNEAVVERLKASDKPEIQALASLRLVPNLYIIGTVNVDETTHPFSKKVLDRANVLESGDVDLMAGIQDPDQDEAGEETTSSVPTLNHFFAGRSTDLPELKREWKGNSALTHMEAEATLRQWVELLQKFALVLKPHKMNFGFRVRDEVCLYLYHAACLAPDATAQEGWWLRHFDRQLVQKVLTRFGGEQNQIENDIAALFGLCVAQDFQAATDQVQSWVFEPDPNGEAATDPPPRFPAAARKLQRMLLEVTDEDKPATSFWTA